LLRPAVLQQGDRALRIREVVSSSSATELVYEIAVPQAAAQQELTSQLELESPPSVILHDGARQYRAAAQRPRLRLRRGATHLSI
jgi:hypothetical protein